MVDIFVSFFIPLLQEVKWRSTYPTDQDNRTAALWKWQEEGKGENPWDMSARRDTLVTFARALCPELRRGLSAKK